MGVSIICFTVLQINSISISYCSHNMFAPNDSIRTRHSSLVYRPLYLTFCYTYSCRMVNILTEKLTIS